MTLTELVREAHRNSIEKGFWWDTAAFKESPIAASFRAGPSSLDIQEILSKLMLIVTEVAEAAEVLREWGGMREVSQVPELHDREHLGEELADILIRTADLAGALDLDLEMMTIAKIARNRNRPHKHGKLA